MASSRKNHQECCSRSLARNEVIFKKKTFIKIASKTESPVFCSNFFIFSKVSQLWRNQQNLLPKNLHNCDTCLYKKIKQSTTKTEKDCWLLFYRPAGSYSSTFIYFIQDKIAYLANFPTTLLHIYSVFYSIQLNAFHRKCGIDGLSYLHS